MNKNKYQILLLILILIMTGCKKENGKIEGNENNNGDIVQENPIDDEIAEVDKIEEMIKNMILEEKIGQLIIVGKEGLEINEDDIHQIENNKVGGFIFFSRNVDNENQVLNLLNELKNSNSSNKIPLFLSIDEEGGAVSRLSQIYGKLPTAKKLGEKSNQELSFEYGKILGLSLKKLGFNLDFAPVLDINSNPKNPIIGDRAYGNTVEKVVENGISVMDGIHSEGIISSVKHFPGHGDTSVDSHLDLPRIDKSLDELENLELYPFKEAINKDADMIMVAHILFPQLDDKYPASMSGQIINKLLREKLNFNGVIVSDDITMGAITENYSIGKGAIEFLKSGGDIILVCHEADNPSIVLDAIKMGIEEGEVSIDEIDKKVYRILSLKDKYNLKDDKIENIDINDVIDRINKLNEKIS
ncbi:beta-N-acetylhexosaminidase [Paratissierella segnis]|jgi:beta-N-acetylhexosaminidase|uniref:Beta-N-acetylhexosaminidase n=1 Tax=Paratissierella segnis TaxID=2763679 RepID=A0A926EWC7_9FIRM|nr:beta-N-acetylhexosaminidase [Paratissierella segnis]MBC8588737.1 beta-N-acetylhexosaminidase [Paratissierella segnis]